MNGAEFEHEFIIGYLRYDRVLVGRSSWSHLRRKQTCKENQIKTLTDSERLRPRLRCSLDSVDRLNCLTCAQNSEETWIAVRRRVLCVRCYKMHFCGFMNKHILCIQDKRSSKFRGTVSWSAWYNRLHCQCCGDQCAWERKAASNLIRSDTLLFLQILWHPRTCKIRASDAKKSKK